MLDSLTEKGLRCLEERIQSKCRNIFDKHESEFSKLENEMTLNRFLSLAKVKMSDTFKARVLLQPVPVPSRK